MRSYTPDNLTFLGGRYDTHDLAIGDFWASWRSLSANMPYVVIDLLGDGVRVGALAWFDDFERRLPSLWRLHLFGPGGDLIWRRDEDWAFWRYVGEKTSVWPAQANPHNFWGENRISELLIDVDRPLRALLWGQYDSQHDRWHEDRVGQATVSNRLRYPVAGVRPGERVEVLAWELRQPHDNVVAAIWTHDLRVWSPDSDGEA